ncbi:unnamed protein product, partial [Ectocarpus fasciculatus]
YIRAFTVACILIVAGAFSFGSYYVVFYFEGRLQNEEFDSLAKQLETTTLHSMEQKVSALQSMSHIVAMVCPDVATWPNCSVPMNSFFNFTDPLIEMAEMRALAFTPIITPEQVSKFEAFAYETYEEGGYPNMGISSFGRGISSVNTTTGGRYHDTQGPDLNNQYQILTPVMQIGNLDENRAAVMFNLYSQAYRISAIDFMINCFNSGRRDEQCVSITDVIHLVQDPEFRPAVLVIHPISANSDFDTLVGLDYGVLNWDTVLSNAIPEFVGGIEVVLSGGVVEYTFRIREGQASLKSTGDSHDSKYDGSKRKFTIPFFAGSVVYSLTVYQTDEFFDRFHTDLPVYALLIALAIVILTSAIFFVYDYKMKREAIEREVVMNTKRLFVRFISHEIRTPMNIVHLGLKLIAKEMMAYVATITDDASVVGRTVVPQLVDWVKLAVEIEESSDAAILVLNDLINYDKISLGGMSIETEPLNMWSTIATTVKPFMVQARENDISLTLNIEAKNDDIPISRRKELQRLKMIGDPIKISQVIRNLLSNALKFTPASGKVEVTAIYIENGLPLVKMEQIEKNFSFTKTGSILITVKDTGHGISKEDQQSLFREGIQFRANQLQAGGGSGLGLWISKGVVELHKGSLSAFSEGEDKGTTFSLEIPVGYMFSPFTDGHDVHGASQRIDDDIDASPELKIKTILCVDDSTASRKITCRMLKHCGYVCYQAGDGEECLSIFDSLSQEGVIIDAVLMDFEMPKMNGPTATREMVKRGCTSPIIGVTGNVLQADREIFFEHGAAEVLAKPLSVEHLEA